jgi:hypothetical protein
MVGQAGWLFRHVTSSRRSGSMTALGCGAEHHSGKREDPIADNGDEE